MKILRLAPLLAGALALAACESDQEPMGPGQTMSGGTAMAGAPAAPIADGVVLGALMNTKAGKSLSDADIAFMNQQSNRALESAPTNQPVTWQNPEGGDQGQVMATRTYQQADGAYCRDYIQSIIVKGQPQSARGTACRKSNGTWQAMG